MKTCTKCAEVKSLSEFGRRKRGSDALHSQCKACRRENKRQWKKSNPERDREQWQRWRDKQPAGTLPYQRAWYEAQDPAERTRQSRERKRANPELYREINRRSYHRNLERSRALAREQFHRRREASRGMTVDASVIATLAAQACVYCGGTEHIEIDHITPLSRGGKHTPENLAPACRPCNRSKGAKLLSEWLAVV
jgi:5-methylcytosine-specific restriction endonuclease McrA